MLMRWGCLGTAPLTGTRSYLRCSQNQGKEGTPMLS